MTEIEKLVELERAAEPGPWEVVFSSMNGIERGVRTSAGFVCFLPKPSHYEGQDERYKEEMAEYEATAAFIAAARTAVPELIAALKGAEGERDEARVRAETFERQYRQVSQDHATIRAERDAAVAALRPFAELNVEFERRYSDYADHVILFGCGGAVVTHGDFRRAALASNSGGGDAQSPKAKPFECQTCDGHDIDCPECAAATGAKMP